MAGNVSGGAGFWPSGVLISNPAARPVQASEPMAEGGGLRLVSGAPIRGGVAMEECAEQRLDRPAQPVAGLCITMMN